MRLIENNIIPFKGFGAINLMGVVFVRRDWIAAHSLGETARLSRHEAIHTAQMRELGYIGFYLLYLLEWLFRLVFHPKTAYRGISFEREAYAHENDLFYIDNRKPFAQWRK